MADMEEVEEVEECMQGERRQSPDEKNTRDGNGEHRPILTVR